jgi:uncharacterized protein (TIGR00304 family)
MNIRFLPYVIYRQHTDIRRRISRKMESLVELLSFIGLVTLLIGVALIVLGVVLTITRRGSKRNRDNEKEGERNKRELRVGGVVMLGPIPIIFGTDRKMLLIALVAALALIAFYILLSSS